MPTPFPLTRLLPVKAATFSLGCILLAPEATRAEPLPAAPSVRAFERARLAGARWSAARLVVELAPFGDEASARTLAADVGCRFDRRIGRSPYFAFSCRADLPSALRTLAEHPRVVWVEPAYAALPQARPDDLTPILWYLENTGPIAEFPLTDTSDFVPGVDIGAVPAWEAVGAAEEVLVAVIDDGVWAEHPDLADRMWTNPADDCQNGVDDDRNGYVDDCRGWDTGSNDNDPGPSSGACFAGGHGTFIAGIIAARAGNGRGVAGIAANARILAVKAVGEEIADGEVEGCGLSTVALAEAVWYATDRGAQVINASWSTPSNSRLLREAFEHARGAGVLVAMAAGNDGANLDATRRYPIDYGYPYGLAVAAHDAAARLAPFSGHGNKVDIAAPGRQIVGLALDSEALLLADGTSFATPMVSGALALLRGVDPDAPPETIVQAILTGATPEAHLVCGGGRPCVKSGGRLSLPGALGALAGDPERDPAGCGIAPGEPAPPPWILTGLVVAFVRSGRRRRKPSAGCGPPVGQG